MRVVPIACCVGLVAIAGVAVGSREHVAEPPSKPNPFAHGTGVTPQMKSMGWLAGTWKVQMTYHFPGGKTFEKETESVIEPLLGGAFLQERISVPAGPNLDNPMVGIRSFDRFRDTYRVVWLDSVITIADVFEGSATGDGFQVSNLKTNTAGVFNGSPATMRITQTHQPDHASFSLKWEVTPDAGKTWLTTADYAYSRK